jgi:hypothetical protein
MVQKPMPRPEIRGFLRRLMDSRKVSIAYRPYAFPRPPRTQQYMGMRSNKFPRAEFDDQNKALFRVNCRKCPVVSRIQNEDAGIHRTERALSFFATTSLLV